MKALKFLAIPVLAALMLCFVNVNTASAQGGLELTIQNTAAGNLYKGIKTDLDCAGNFANNTWGAQAVGTGVYYPATTSIGDAPVRMAIYDQFGNVVVIYAPGFGPTAAVFPTGTVAEWLFYAGCSAHPAVVVVY